VFDGPPTGDRSVYGGVMMMAVVAMEATRGDDIERQEAAF